MTPKQIRMTKREFKSLKRKQMTPQELTLEKINKKLSEVITRLENIYGMLLKERL